MLVFVPHGWQRLLLRIFTVHGILLEYNTMTMDIPPYISVSILGNPSFNCAATKENPSENRPTSCDSNKSEETSITILPKKRSFDVAFLISSDNKNDRRKVQNVNESPISPNETIRSAFRKVGLGFPKFDSRSPSPIDPIRTPSPYEIVPEKHNIGIRPQFVPKEAMFHPLAGLVNPKMKDHDKSMGFPGGSFLNPVNVSRSTFLPAPIFTGAPIIPAGFVTASLLPPSLAALALPAQNVCAKCNVSFRMTSDLVYHMRSHHKNDHTSPDQLRRRRELDKLKCPVCNESFRERHHLTRHMTAHQDKEGDNLEGGESRDRNCRMKFCASPPGFHQ